MSNYKAPEHRHSQSDILIYAWMNEDRAREILNIENEIDKAKYIKRLVADYGGFDVTHPDFLLGRKNGNCNTNKKYLRYTDCRQAGMYLTKKHTRLSLRTIGNLFGRKDHATVSHASNKIRNMLTTQDKFITDMIRFCEQQLAKIEIPKTEAA